MRGDKLFKDLKEQTTPKLIKILYSSLFEGLIDVI